MDPIERIREIAATLNGRGEHPEIAEALSLIAEHLDAPTPTP